MKRSNEDPHQGSPKRHKHTGNVNDFQHSQAHDGAQNGRYNNRNGKREVGQTPVYGAGGERVVKPNQTRSRQPSQTTSVSVDPAATLEALLESLVSCPDAVKQVLGAGPLDSAVQLLAALSSRDKTATASLDLFQPNTISQPALHHYSPTSLPSHSALPTLPEVPQGPYSEAPFTHKSTIQHDRVSAAGDLTYERLEFLGDAYIEIIATRLIFSRYPHLAAGRQAQIRERLVKNETLSEFSRAYHFRDRLHVNDQEAGAAPQNPKGAGKILADVFEAYTAAVVLSDPARGFERVEAWLTELWAPILLREFGPGSGSEAAVQSAYNANAKQELQQRILGRGTRLDYREVRPMEQSKHSQKYFVGLYLTGWGYDNRFLGYGEGQNKVEAGNRAAMQAMVTSHAVVSDAAAQLAVVREQKRREKEEEEAA
ncbi:hypothetical protein MBLNU459_g5467t1 [Dothideomycetes sp. NU459]